EGRRRRDEAALAENGLDDDRRDALGRDVGFEELLERGDRALAAPAAIFIRKGGLVDLGRVGAEVLLVGLDRAGEGEREQGAAVEGTAEADDRGAAGRRAGDLHGVLDGLGA